MELTPRQRANADILRAGLREIVRDMPEEILLAALQSLGDIQGEAYDVDDLVAFMIASAAFAGIISALEAIREEKEFENEP